MLIEEIQHVFMGKIQSEQQGQSLQNPLFGTVSLSAFSTYGVKPENIFETFNKSEAVE